MLFLSSNDWFEVVKMSINIGIEGKCVFCEVFVSPKTLSLIFI